MRGNLTNWIIVCALLQN